MRVGAMLLFRKGECQLEGKARVKTLRLEQDWSISGSAKKKSIWLKGNDGEEEAGKEVREGRGTGGSERVGSW